MGTYPTKADRKDNTFKLFGHVPRLTFDFSRVTVMPTVSPPNRPTKLCDTSAALIASLMVVAVTSTVSSPTLTFHLGKLGTPSDQPLLRNHSVPTSLGLP